MSPKKFNARFFLHILWIALIRFRKARLAMSYCWPAIPLERPNLDADELFLAIYCVYNLGNNTLKLLFHVGGKYFRKM